MQPVQLQGLPTQKGPAIGALMFCGCCREIHNCLNFELLQWNMPQGLGAWLTRTPLPGTSLTLDCLLPCPTGPPDPSCCLPGQGVLCCWAGSSGPGGPLSLQTASLVIIARPTNATNIANGYKYSQTPTANTPELSCVLIKPVFLN